MEPEEFSSLGMYGNREIFKKRLNEGYTKVAYGGGKWVDNHRIVGLWAFFHPKNKKVATYEHPKFDDGVLHTVRGTPFEATYTESVFKEYCEKHKIRLNKKQDLAKVVQNWED